MDGVGSQQVPWWASVAAPAGMLVLTALAALGPAWRAGRLSAVQAIAAGRAPRSGRGLMTTRDRVHDLGIFKALGMRPGQVLTMVVCWIAGPAVLAAVIAAPAAVALNTATIRAMAGTAHTGVPASFTQVFPPSRLALLSLAAIAIAVAGTAASQLGRARPSGRGAAHRMNTAYRISDVLRDVRRRLASADIAGGVTWPP